MAQPSAPAARPLFDFAAPEGLGPFAVVNDGVMGGRSQGRLSWDAGGWAAFSGMLSLENNGGFTSVWSRPAELGLAGARGLRARLRGDGKAYTLLVRYHGTGWTLWPVEELRVNYESVVQPPAGEWTEVFLPFDAMVATHHGQRIRARPLDPAKIRVVGLMIERKQAGPFRLEVAWLRAE